LLSQHSTARAGPADGPVPTQCRLHGSSKGELLGLRKSDVDLANRLIIVSRSYDRESTKGGTAESVRACGSRSRAVWCPNRDMIRPGEIKRVYEAIYAKVLVGDDAVSVPTEEGLTVRTKAVWAALFGPLRSQQEVS
jgi:hypothetical protein